MDHVRYPRRVQRRAKFKHDAEIWRRVDPWRQQGYTWDRCAKRLNAEGIRTFQGGEWKISNLHSAARRGAWAATVFTKEREIGHDLSNALF